MIVVVVENVNRKRENVFGKYCAMLSDVGGKIICSFHALSIQNVCETHDEQ